MPRLGPGTQWCSVMLQRMRVSGRRPAGERHQAQVVRDEWARPERAGGAWREAQLTQGVITLGWWNGRNAPRQHLCTRIRTGCQEGKPSLHFLGVVQGGALLHRKREHDHGPGLCSWGVDPGTLKDPSAP